MRPDAKARRVRIPGVFERGATPPGGMQRRPNAAGLSPRAAGVPHVVATGNTHLSSLPPDATPSGGSVTEDTAEATTSENGERSRSPRMSLRVINLWRNLLRPASRQ